MSAVEVTTAGKTIAMALVEEERVATVGTYVESLAMVGMAYKSVRTMMWKSFNCADDR